MGGSGGLLVGMADGSHGDTPRRARSGGGGFVPAVAAAGLGRGVLDGLLSAASAVAESLSSSSGAWGGVRIASYGYDVGLGWEELTGRRVCGYVLCASSVWACLRPLCVV